MKAMIRIMAISTIATVISVTLWLALVGAIFLYHVQPRPITATTCDRITTYEDNSLVCEVIMHNEDDNITIVRSN